MPEGVSVVVAAWPVAARLVDRSPQLPVVEDSKGTRRRAFSRFAPVIVQAAKEPGTIRLTAESPGLESAAVEITAAEARIRLRVL